MAKKTKAVAVSGNQIAFWVPKSPLPVISGAADLPTKLANIHFPKDVKAFAVQFQSASTGHVPLVLDPLQILKAALNSGYGVDRKEMQLLTAKKWSPKEWAALEKYLQARLKMLLAVLVESGTPSVVTLLGVADMLEASEKVGIAYALGSIFCRVATDAWIDNFHPKQTVQHFWHWKVACDKAVNLGALRNLVKKSENPDYIFSVKDTWYCVEAKGTLEGEDWNVLKVGLHQAKKIGSLELIDPLAPYLPVPRPIQGFACTLAYFDKADALQIIHLDPPVSKPKRRSIRKTLTLVPEFAELVGFERAFSQFLNLAQPTHVPRELLEATKPMVLEWKLMHHDADAAACIYLGMSSSMHTLEVDLDQALRALRLIVPTCALAASRQPDGLVSLPHLDMLLAQLQRASSTVQDAEPTSMWRALCDVVDAFIKDGPENRAGVPWQTLLARVTTVKWLGIPTDLYSVQDLHRRLTGMCDAAKTAAEICALSPPKHFTNGAATIATTDQGLWLVTDLKNQPLPPREGKGKI